MSSPAGKDGKAREGIVKAAGAAVAAGVALGILSFVKSRMSAGKSKHSVSAGAGGADNYVDTKESYDHHEFHKFEEDKSGRGDHVAAKPARGIMTGSSQRHSAADQPAEINNKTCKSSPTASGKDQNILHIHKLEEEVEKVTRDDHHAAPQPGQVKEHNKTTSTTSSEEKVQVAGNKDAAGVDEPHPAAKKPWYMSIFGDPSKDHKSDGTESVRSSSTSGLESSTTARSETKRFEAKSKTTAAHGGSGGMYEIRKGDTLWAISGKHGVSLDSLMAANGLREDKIYPGDKLVIPRV